MAEAALLIPGVTSVPEEPSAPGAPQYSSAAAKAAANDNTPAERQARRTARAQAADPAVTSSTATATATAAATANTDQTNAQNATTSITQTLASLGLSGMASWATNLAYQLAGQGIDPTDIVSTITSQMNNPTNADGSVNTDALAAFNAALPGFNQLIANTGQNGSPGSSPAQAIANYISYGAQVNQFAQQAGLLPGTITSTEIGQLWAGQVSSSEVSQRITDAVVATSTAPQQVQDYLSSNYGMTPQALTSYYLNPQNTLQTITSNLNSGMVGGEASITGFDKDLSVAQSQALGAFLANGASAGSSSAIGTPNAVTAGEANNFFTQSLGSNQAGGQLGSLAQMSNFETALPGQEAGTGAVTESTLLSAAEGDQAALAQTAQAQQARTAGGKGGGGATTTANGAVGLGYANS